MPVAASPTRRRGSTGGILRRLVVHCSARLCKLQRASHNLTLLKKAIYKPGNEFVIRRSRVRLLSPTPYMLVNYSFRSPFAIGKIALGNNLGSTWHTAEWSRGQQVCATFAITIINCARPCAGTQLLDRFCTFRAGQSSMAAFAMCWCRP